MSNTSTYLQTARLNQALRGMVMVPPQNTYLALFTADPTDANIAANEQTGAWYARFPLGTATGWSAPSAAADDLGGMQSSNLNQITFEAVTDAQTTITHAAIMDAAEAGNLLYHCPLAQAKILQVGDMMQFQPGELIAVEA
ncbi:MAG: hypothetical protein WDN30_14075 [Pararobbsia sp.]